MPKLGAMAHFSAKGDRNAHVGMEDPLENRGFALWLSCQGKIRTSKAKKVYGPTDRGVGEVFGFEIEVNLKRKCFDLWPGLNQMDRPSQDAFISEIYSYLRASGNACCTRQPGLGQHGIPLWWFRETWNDVKAVGVFKPTELTPREKRLTPKEAGEDREPAPVTVKQREDAAVKQEAATATLTETRTALILELIQKNPQPLYQREIAEATGLTSLVTGHILRDLQERGKIFRRQESKGERPDEASGRYRYLYWHEKKVPLRKTQMDIGNQTMERVWAMKPGESLSTTWMSPGNQQRVAEMVEQGLLEYVNQGTGDERIKLAPATPSLEESTEETTEIASAPAETVQETLAPEPAPVTAMTGVVQPPERMYTGMEAIGAAIARLVEDEVEKRTGGLQLETLRQQISEERTARQRAESALIAARTELSDARRERDEMQEKFNTIRRSLGL